MQVLTEEDQQRLANIGKNGSRDVTGLTMTQWSPTNASFLRSISTTIVALGLNNRRFGSLDQPGGRAQG